MLQPPLSRREFLWKSGGGLGGIALASLAGGDALLGADMPHSARPPHFTPKAKRVVQLFMAGAASHIDLFDYKPELIKRHGQPSRFRRKGRSISKRPRSWLRPIWDFEPYGQCGKMISEVVAPLGAVVDDIAFIQTWSARRASTAGHAAADDRLQPPRVSRHGLLGELWVGEHKRQSAYLRRAAGSPRA